MNEYNIGDLVYYISWPESYPKIVSDTIKCVIVREVDSKDGPPKVVKEYSFTSYGLTFRGDRIFPTVDELLNNLRTTSNL